MLDEAEHDRLYALAEPLVESFRFIIPFAWIPLAILWFGIHEAGKIFIIWYAGFFLVLLHTLAGVRGVDPDPASLPGQVQATRKPLLLAHADNPGLLGAKRFAAGKGRFPQPEGESPPAALLACPARGRQSG